MLRMPAAFFSSFIPATWLVSPVMAVVASSLRPAVLSEELIPAMFVSLRMGAAIYSTGCAIYG